MANKMLIDASHPEETRVVVLRGNRIEEFDFEAANKKQLRGNIYLAKVTRVEPSLQAAFIDYGGNRHGFLAFSEIHPDYYQIPVADRQALLEDEARAHEQEEEEERSPRRSRRRRTERPKRRNGRDESVSTEAELNGEGQEAHHETISEESINAVEPHAEAHGEHVEHVQHVEAEPHVEVEPVVPAHDHVEAPVAEAAPQADHAPALHAEPAAEVVSEPAPEHVATIEAESHAHEPHAQEIHTDAVEAHADEAAHDHHDDQPVEARGEARESDDEEDDEERDEEAEAVEQLGGDEFEETFRAPRLRRQYKIQEVIKRRQVLLVQVVKEERGNKGAALTTYLSLAGRYSVLMPNTARGGGISRKITDATDRKRLKELVQDLEVPEGMGVILRTAGASRTKQEIRRDFEYLLRMWETVRELTLKSSAPNLVYEEGSLIKRSIRDLYNKDIDDVIVAGDEGYREAKDFMRLLMPTHVKNVVPWRETQAVFARYGVEAQLDAMFSNIVTLKSGGYIVINQTEALVAIDVNSGRSTREHNIEDTAVRTNLEAADEVARQLRLRDLAGLIVVDFIDMEENRNNRSVERRIKEALKNDRARIQVGRISHFGLLEMSRQRMRTGVLEGSTVVCPHCAGSGMMRSAASIALHILRVLEDALIKNAQYNLIVRARSEVALYILNQKRSHLRDIEARFGVSIMVMGDETLTGTVNHALERGDLASPPEELRRQDLVRIDSIIPDDIEEEVVEAEEEAEEVTDRAEGEAEGDDADGETAQESEANRRRRRRRRRGGRNDREGGFLPTDAPQPSDTGLAMMAEIAGDMPGSLAEATVSDGDSDEAEAEGFDVEGNGEEGDRRRRRRSRRGGRNRRRERGDGEGEAEGEVGLLEEGAAPVAQPADDFAPEVETPVAPVEIPAPSFAQPHVHADAHAELPTHEHPAPVVEASHPVVAEAPEPAPVREQPAPLPEAPIDPNRPKRSGWWQRAKQSFGG